MTRVSLLPPPPLAQPHIICATPGRLLFHLQNTKGFSLKSLKYLVLDEADRLLNMDYEEEIDQILAALPKERHTYLFSATMTSKVKKLERASLTNPVKISVSSKYQTVDTLLQHYVFVPEKFKDCYLVYLLNEFVGNTTIVFVATCNAAQRLALLLRNLGFQALPIHGKMSQSRRIGSLNTFKTGDRNILLATDVASRGLDIPSVDLIINYDIPLNPKDYIHRVGRTARAQRAGRAVSVVTQYDIEFFQKIEELTGLKMEVFPTEREHVMLLLERVMEAQRFAAAQLKEQDFKQGKAKKRKGEESMASNDSEMTLMTSIKKRSGKGKPTMKKRRVF
jgi:ATP-dependent RNA helicase DDX47/RRP3